MQNIIIAIVFSIISPFFLKKKYSQLVFAIGMPLLVVLQLFLMQISHEYDTVSLKYAIPIVFSVTKIYLNFAVFISILWLLASVYSVFYITKNYDESKLAKFMPYYNASVGFAILTAFASNLFTTFIFYELLTLVTLPLVGFGGKLENKKFLTKYAIILLFCSIALFLPAIFMFQGMVGTTEFMQGDGTILTIFGQDFSQNDSTLNNYQYTPSTFLMVVIFTMMLFGVAKSAIFPFHSWLPAAMCAPAPVSALLHAVAVVKIGVFVLYKIIYELYGMQYMLHLQALYPLFFTVITIVVVVGIIIASIQALQTFDIKRILAFSTIANMGYIILLFLSFSESGMQAGFLAYFCSWNYQNRTFLHRWNFIFHLPH
jgi:multicomponent Na+:H+ antiporter subunit D